MTHFINIGNEIIFDVREIASFGPVDSVKESDLARAMDLSDGFKRTFIITKSGRIYISKIRTDTIAKRIEHLEG
jgi:regulator of extracellular matrix RemA (YlzA/DUF370 family)